MTTTPNPPTILVTGKNGQVGWELQRSLMPLGRVVAVDRHGMDLSNNDSIVNCIREIKPDIIVNAAAYTAVDKAEEEPELAMQINGTAPGIIAQEAKALGALLVHYSTDYVFDGTKQTPYLETDTPNPINEYGVSKRAGERAIEGADCDYIVFRTTWVCSHRGRNFLHTVLRLALQKEELKIVEDQVGVPTSARSVADATALAMIQINRRYLERKEIKGIYHLTSSGVTNWCDYARRVLEMSIEGGVISLQKVPEIIGIKTEEYPLPAMRPKNSLLDNQKIKKVFGVELGDWKQEIRLCIESIVLNA